MPLITRIFLAGTILKKIAFIDLNTKEIEIGLFTALHLED